jgi:putative ABC transport system permease protein
MASVLAQRMNKHVGDTIEIETEEGKKAFRIAAVANDYLVGGLGIYMNREVAQRLLKQRGVDGYAIFAKDEDLDRVKAALQKITDKHDVLLLSNADISRNVSRIVNAVDWCLWALVYLGFVVAAFGVVNTLTMNVLEQTRELGLLRIVAMTRRQLRRTILMQALLIGGVGLSPGVLAGIAVAFVMNVAMEPAFGHPIAFNIHPWLLIGSLVGSLLITAMAAYFPARRAAQINVVDALHYE